MQKGEVCDKKDNSYSNCPVRALNKKQRRDDFRFSCKRVNLLSEEAGKLQQQKKEGPEGEGKIEEDHYFVWRPLNR